MPLEDLCVFDATLLLGRSRSNRSSSETWSPDKLQRFGGPRLRAWHDFCVDICSQLLVKAQVVGERSRLEIIVRGALS
jgi:hypothetical protein